MIDSPNPAQEPASRPAEIKPPESTQRPSSDPSFGADLAVFVQRIEALARTLPLVTAVLLLTEREASKRLNAFLKKKCTPKPDSDGKVRSYSIPSDHSMEFGTLKVTSE